MRRARTTTIRALMVPILRMTTTTAMDRLRYLTRKKKMKRKAMRGTGLPRDQRTSLESAIME